MVFLALSPWFFYAELRVSINWQEFLAYSCVSFLFGAVHPHLVISSGTPVTMQLRMYSPHYSLMLTGRFFDKHIKAEVVCISSLHSTYS
jgi:hypothetical protein